mgnify:CR=1 FL=1
MTNTAVTEVKHYVENFSFETLINRSMGSGHNGRYPEFSNLVLSEEGMSSRGFGTPDKHLEKTKRRLSKALSLLMKKRIISKDKKLLLAELVSMVEKTTHSSEISKIVSHALDITNEYKERL